MMRRTAIGLAFLLTFTLAAQERIELREGVLVSPTEDTAYAMTPDGGIAAVDLFTGATKWTTKNAAKPLLLIGNRLLCQVQPATLAQRDDLLLAALDVTQGGALIARGALDLPDDVNTSVTETPFGRFAIAVKKLDADSASVKWGFVAAAKRALSPESEEGADSPGPGGPGPALPTMLAERIREFLGHLRINLATGTVGEVSESERAVDEPDDFVLDDSETDDQPGTQYKSADGRALLVSERIADDSEWNNYKWTVSDVATGAKLGELKIFTAFAPFIVRRGVLVIETKPFLLGAQTEPAKLRGYDLATGNEKWNFTVREVVFRGPTPP